LPLPVRNERGEGRGEGQPTADTPACLQARPPSSPQPSPPSAGGEGDERGAQKAYSAGERDGVRGQSDAPAGSSFVVRPEVCGRSSRDDRILCPDAAMLAQLASRRADFVSGELLAPIYLVEAIFVKAPTPRIIR
ncbi:MAG TPA: hypothetical protein VGK40_01450, partial [Verrucomicrobiae bacterium]